jgi:steroid 5-alpha reductase family enzyme
MDSGRGGERAWTSRALAVPDVLVVAGLTLAVAVVAMTGTAWVAARAGRVSVVDVAWGLGLLGVAVVAALLAGDWRGRLLVALVGVWGGRLSAHVLARSRGQGEDPRYLEILGGPLDRVGMRTAVRRVFVLQGAAVWLVALPLQAAAVTTVEWARVVWAGVVVWALGVFFEAVGDAQLAAYRRDPGRGPVLDRGLWSWTRHPNYFGDACVWWGIWLVGGLASGPPAALVTVASPVAMTVWLVWVTGARLLERTMMRRPGYPEYAARTSMFIPRPPRRGRGR